MEKPQVDKPVLVFATLWIAGFIFFNIAQVVCGLAWDAPAYEWRLQIVSDLGETHAPLNIIMNIAFIFQGVVIAIGVWVIDIIWHRSVLTVTTRTMLTLAGIGLIVVGFAPADTDPEIHLIFGAAPILLFGAFGLVFACITMNGKRFGRFFWIVTALLGIAALISGFVFFVSAYTSLGRGFIERIWIYAPLVWTAYVGYRIVHTNKQSATSISSPLSSK